MTSITADSLKREFLLATTPKEQGVIKRKATKKGFKIVPSIFGCHVEKIENVPRETDKVISVMETEWKRLKEIERMYFEIVKEYENQ